jgi:phosphomannomutase
MALIKSISGIRGTIGGPEGDNLTGIDIVKFTSAYAQFIKNENPAAKAIVVGRDARVSGPMVSNLVEGTLMAMGLDVINIGLATTPTTELAVVWENADGGIIITASHNPAQWNALKLLNAHGEFLNDAQGKEVLRLAAASDEVKFVDYAALGHKYTVTTCDRKHIEAVLNLPLVDKAAIEKANFTVAVDAVNSVGGVVIPQLLRELGVKNVIELNCEPTGKFAHTPEPIPENLTQIADLMKEGRADVGIVVDPDVDRLAIVMENGEMFVEEYTLVAVADYVLANTPGNTVSNLSSSRALRDVTARYAGCEYNAAAVGEVNVVTKMKETNAIIGGEGNGGVIYPELHYGRDALVGVALFLTLLAKSGKKVSELKATYPPYAIAKNKIQLTPDINVDAILDKVKELYANEKVTDIDGVKIDFAESWVHLRKSNTEPIIRIYSEAATMAEAEKLGDDMKKIIASL